MPVARSQRPSASGAERGARGWLGLALGVLVLAGLFSLVVAVGSMPPFDRYVTAPLFFKRGLVVHVNLALVAWFYSFIAALLLAAITFVAAWWNLPSGVEVDVYYELLVWGGGHVPQLACTLAMLAVWLILLTSALGRSPAGRPRASPLLRSESPAASAGLGLLAQ
jgi:hypothetical protein